MIYPTPGSGQTLVEKIVQGHMCEGPDGPVRAGDTVSLRPRHVLTHDNTSAVMSKFRSIGVRQVRYQSGGIHLYSQDHMRLHFSLGANARVDELLVRWPDGTEQRIEDVEADHVIRITEPGSESSPGSWEAVR